MVFSSPTISIPGIMADHCGYSNENHFAARTYWPFNMKNHQTRLAKFTLVSWIGQTDLNAAQGDATAGIGPIAQAAAFKNFTRIVLLSNYPTDPTQRYLDWLRQRTDASPDLRPFTLSSPMHFGEITRRRDRSWAN